MMSAGELLASIVVLPCRFDPLGFAPKSAEEFDTLQTKEINNGRLAMVTVAGYVAQELVNNKGILENLF